MIARTTVHYRILIIPVAFTGGGDFSCPATDSKPAALDDFINHFGLDAVRVVYSGEMCFSKFELINDHTLDTIPVDCFRQTYGAELKAYDARVPHYETPVRIF